MAQKSNIAGQIAGIAVVIAIVVGLWYLIKKYGFRLFGDWSGVGMGGPGGSELTESPGTVPGAAINTGGNPSSVASRVFAGTNLPDLSVPGNNQGADTGPGHDAVTSMIKKAVGKGVGKAVHSVKDVLDGGFGHKLSRANMEARQYRNKPGTTNNIVNTLNKILALPDTDFIKVIRDWMHRDNVKDFYNSDIAASMIGFDDRNKGAQSRFLTRVRQLGLDK